MLLNLCTLNFHADTKLCEVAPRCILLKAVRRFQEEILTHLSDTQVHKCFYVDVGVVRMESATEQPAKYCCNIWNGNILHLKASPKKQSEITVYHLPPYAAQTCNVQTLNLCCFMGSIRCKNCALSVYPASMWMLKYQLTRCHRNKHLRVKQQCFLLWKRKHHFRLKK